MSNFGKGDHNTANRIGSDVPVFRPKVRPYFEAHPNKDVTIGQLQRICPPGMSEQRIQNMMSTAIREERLPGLKVIKKGAIYRYETDNAPVPQPRMPVRRRTSRPSKFDSTPDESGAIGSYPEPAPAQPTTPVPFVVTVIIPIKDGFILQINGSMYAAKPLEV